MLSIIKNQISMTRGDTAILHVDLAYPDGTPYDLQEGDVVRFTVRKNPGAGDKLIEKTGLEIIIDPADTAKMPFGKYAYDIEVTRENGIVDTVIPPTLFELCEEVTY